MRRIAFGILALIFTFAVAGHSPADWQQDLRKDYDRVMKSTRNVLGLHRGLIAKWKAEGHLADLIEIYSTDIRKNPNSPELNYALGYAFLVAGTDKLDQAGEHLRIAAELLPNEALVHYTYGGYFLLKENWQRAIDEYNESLRIDEKYHTAYYGLGKAYKGKGDLDAAIEAFGKAIEFNPKWGLPYYEAGIIWMDQKDYARAEEAFKRAIKYDEKFRDAYFKLGQLYAMMRRDDDALESYRKGSLHGGYEPEPLRALAVIFHENGNDGYAIQSLKKAIEVDPDYAEAYLMLGEIYFSQGESSLATDNYRLAIEHDPELRTHFLDLARAYFQQKATAAEAKVALDKQLLINPLDVTAHLMYAQIEEDEGNIDLAIYHHEQVVNIDPSQVDSYLALGNLYFGKGETDRAKEFFLKAIELKPELDLLFLNESQGLYDSGRYAEALLPVSKFLLIHPDSAGGHLLKAKCHDQLGDSEQAIAEFQIVLELDKANAEALSYLSEIFMRRKEFSEAITYLNRLVEIAPDDANVHLKLGISHREMGDLETAFQHLAKTVELDPRNYEGHRLLGHIYEDTNRPDDAMREYQTAIEIDNTKSDPFLRLGWLYLGKDDKESAIDFFGKGLEIEPRYPDEQYQLARLLDTERGALEESLKHYALANEYKPDVQEWHFRYADALDRMARSVKEFDRYAEKAMEEYALAIQLNLNDPRPYYQRALLARHFKQIGGKLYRSELIVEDLKQVIALDKDNADAYYHLGMTYIDMDMPTKAQPVLQSALRLNPNIKGANLALGIIAEERLRDYRQAIKYYEAEVRIDNDNAEAHRRLGDLYRQFVMDFALAEKHLKRAHELDPTNVTVLINYANTLFNMGKNGAAIEKFEQALEIKPDDLTANFNLAMLYAYVGRNQLAIDRYRRFLKLNPPEKWAKEARQALSELEGR